MNASLPTADLVLACWLLDMMVWLNYKKYSTAHERVENNSIEKRGHKMEKLDDAGYVSEAFKERNGPCAVPSEIQRRTAQLGATEINHDD